MTKKKTKTKKKEKFPIHKLDFFPSDKVRDKIEDSLEELILNGKL